jgi:hypothetical protein
MYQGAGLNLHEQLPETLQLPYDVRFTASYPHDAEYPLPTVMLAVQGIEKLVPTVELAMLAFHGPALGCRGGRPAQRLTARGWQQQQQQWQKKGHIKFEART